MAYEASECSDLFVAVSINVERIVQYRGLPERALEALVMLLGVLVISIIGLIPWQDHIRSGSSCS